ncbi:SDH family Clp fold serine proteinase [Noviherbaspirillum denitrificans]|nr:hypothetical protein [Noviherbaspirillum denitrificans]
MASKKNNIQSASRSASEDAPASTSIKTFDLTKNSDVISLVREDDEALTQKLVGEHLNKIVASHGLTDYLVLILFDELDSISSYHSDKIYQAASISPGEKNIFLIVQSGGGRIEPAYLISKTCKRLSRGKFAVAVPRRAKSAATLLSLGADEIHMGLMSELGPIDPQIGGYPALGLANALNKLAELASRFPGASDMMANYLTKNLNLRDLGYFERISESAAQYAQRLLTGKSFPDPHTSETLSKHFVDHYKDHGFVIDSDEATTLLGEMVKIDTPEYKCANEIYRFFDFFEMALRFFVNKEFYYVGTLDGGLSIRSRGKNT